MCDILFNKKAKNMQCKLNNGSIKHTNSSGNINLEAVLADIYTTFNETLQLHPDISRDPKRFIVILKKQMGAAIPMFYDETADESIDDKSDGDRRHEST